MTNAMLDEFVPAATYADIPELLAERYAGLSGYITFPTPEDPARDAEAAAAIARLRAC